MPVQSSAEITEILCFMIYVSIALQALSLTLHLYLSLFLSAIVLRCGALVGLVYELSQLCTC